MVVVGLAITFPLVDMGNRGIPELLRKLLLIPDGLKQARQLFQNGLTAFLVDLCRDGIRTSSFSAGHLFNGFADFFVRGRSVELMVCRQLWEACDGFIVDF